MKTHAHTHTPTHLHTNSLTRMIGGWHAQEKNGPKNEPKMSTESDKNQNMREMWKTVKCSNHCKAY